ATDCPREPANAEASVSDNDHGPDAQARISDGREGWPRLHKQRNSVTFAHPETMQTGCEAAYLGFELVPAHALRPSAPVRRHIDDRDLAVACPCVESAPERHKSLGFLF